MSVTIRKAVTTDAGGIRQLALDANIDAWTAEDYADEISRDAALVVLAIDGTTPVGFYAARIVPGTTETPDAELYNIAVNDPSRRHGIGSGLMNDLLRRLRDKGVNCIWLEVRESNKTAIRFYEKHGFTSEITRPNFYANPTENAVIMRLCLTSDPEGNWV